MDENKINDEGERIFVGLFGLLLLALMAVRLWRWFSGIGIHGSTNNESSVPGRESEGCIRLRDADNDSLKLNYAFLGMKVVIKGEDEGKLPFEN